MTKKEYIKPSVDVVEIEIDSLMLSVSAETDTENTGQGTGSGMGTPDLSNKRRGSWGDLWN